MPPWSFQGSPEDAGEVTFSPGQLPDHPLLRVKCEAPKPLGSLLRAGQDGQDRRVTR